jgi:ATP phosphoribosyltransferase
MTLRIGFAKGRGAGEAMQLMEAGGVQVPEELRSCRVTVHEIGERDLACYVVRGDDLASLLAAGALDAAVGSSIVFDEHDEGSTCVAASLEIGRCRLSLIRPAEHAIRGHRLCTRYPRAAMRLLDDASWTVRTLRGCIEAALFLGLSDAIVDIVETGRTLRTLKLHEERVLCPVQHEVRIRGDARDRQDVLERLRLLMPRVCWEPRTNVR